MTNEPELSIVIPCRNEEANAEAIASAVIAQCESAVASFELIFIDNASDDRTVPIIRAICAHDSRVKLIVNTRNFGQMRSPTYGIFQARGRAVIGMCADFQDPPELIPQFVDRWRAGADIVLGVRQSESSSAGLGLFRDLSYALAKRFGDYPIIPNATGFGLYDAKVVRAIRALNEPEPFFRGMLIETGYPLEQIPYPRPPRAGGRSNNNFFVLLDFALSALAGSSKKLVRLPFLIGAIGGVATLVALIVAVVTAFTGGPAVNWLIVAIFEAQFALLFLFLGLIGDQVRLISERSRATPLVTERERVNFGADR